MARLLLALLLLPLVPTGAAAADDVRITQLEQEIRNLQRQVGALSRQLDEIRNRPARPELQQSRAVQPNSDNAAADDLPRWVDAPPGAMCGPA
jgi:hypothetical protein